MWAPALLQTSLVLWLAQQTLQAAVKPMNWGVKDVGVGVKPEPVGYGLRPGVSSTWLGNKAFKTGIGRPWTKFGGGNLRIFGGGGKVQRPVNGHGRFTLPVPTGPICPGCNGVRTLPTGPICPGCNGVRTRQKPWEPTGLTLKDKHTAYAAGGYMGAGQGAGGYAAGYGDGATGYLGAGGANGYGYGNGYSNGHGYGAELADGAERKSGKRKGGLGGLDSASHAYGYDDSGLMIPDGRFNGVPGGLTNGYKG